MYKLVLFLVILGCCSCKMNEEKLTDEEEEEGEEQLFPFDEIIASNLSKKGSNELEPLKGEWKFIKFAYTEDGYLISDVDSIDSEKLTLQGMITIFKFDYHEDFFCYPYYLNYSISDNLIKFSEYADDYIAQRRFNLFSDEDLEIIDILMNTYSFVIRDDELIIHFTGLEEKNLLILKKIDLPSPPLDGTKWKFVGTFEVGTNIIKELEPKDCEYCYTLSFYSDYQAKVYYISREYMGLDLSLESSNRNPLIEFEEKLITEMYDIDGKYYATNDFIELLCHIKSYTVTEDELKLYYYDIIGSMPSRNTNIYSLFKNMKQ